MAISKAKADALREISKMLETRRGQLVYEINSRRRLLKQTAHELAVFKRQRAELSDLVNRIETGLKTQLEVGKDG